MKVANSGMRNDGMAEYYSTLFHIPLVQKGRYGGWYGGVMEVVEGWLGVVWGLVWGIVGFPGK